jgi:hypothetical protein
LTQPEKEAFQRGYLEALDDFERQLEHARYDERFEWNAAQYLVKFLRSELERKLKLIETGP